MTETHAGALSRIIVVVGQTFPASRTPQRTKAMRALGHAVRTIPITPEGTDYETPPSMVDRLRYRLRVPADPAMTNKKILSTAASADILWLEAADMVRVGTLRSLKAANPSIAIIGYSEDDPEIHVWA